MSGKMACPLALYQFYKLQPHSQVGLLPVGDTAGWPGRPIGLTTPLSRRSLSRVERNIGSPVSENWY